MLTLSRAHAGARSAIVECPIVDPSADISAAAGTRLGVAAKAELRPFWWVRWQNSAGALKREPTAQGNGHPDEQDAHDA